MPEFLEHLHKLVAKCVNASIGRWENLWSSEQPSLVKLVDDDDVLKRLVYTLTNPTESFLVERGKDWPGLITTPEALLGAPLRIPRPDVFFRQEGSTPEAVTLRLTRPAIFQHLGDRPFVERLRKAVTHCEAELRQKARSEGITFLGARRACRVSASPEARPKSHHEPTSLPSPPSPQHHVSSLAPSSTT